MLNTMSELGIPERQATEMRERANIIVRHYSKGQHISFHIDEQECDSHVFGFVLMNEHPNGNGLIFRRGVGNYFCLLSSTLICISDNVNLNYVMKEKPGTAFLLTGKARYKWKHGIPPIEFPRISATVRIFKPHLLTPATLEKISKIFAPPLEQTARNGAKEKVVVNLCLNSNRNTSKPAIITSHVDMKVSI